MRQPTKYQMLLDEFNHALNNIQLYREEIERLKAENKKLREQSYFIHEIELKIEERMKKLEETGHNRVALKELGDFQGWLLCGDDY